MAKAILILDNIDETEISELRANVQLNLYGEDRGEYKNCPLKPLPQKKEVKMPNYVNDYEYERGWNECIDEILGGKEND